MNGQRLDSGSRSLLPALYLRLKAEGIDHPWDAAMHRLYRRVLYRNRLVIRRGLAASSALEAKGIPALLLNGSALVPGYYADPGARAITDIDVMVPEATPSSAIERLFKTELGMQLRKHALHADTYVDGGGFEHNVHWHLLRELAFAGSSRSLWQSAKPIEIEGQRCQTLCPEDHVFHLLVHGLRISDVGPLRWAVDIVTVVRRTPGFDWRRVADQTARNSAASPVVHGLSLLVSEGLLTGGAADTLAAATALAERRRDRTIFAIRMRKPRLRDSLLLPFLLYHRLRRLGESKQRSSLPHFLAALWNLESPRQIPTHAYRRLRAKLRVKSPLR